MIRRGFWLTLGAVLGVTGYRRASRLARSVRPGTQALTSRQVMAGAARAGRYAAEGATFVRDVRDGMAEYLDRHDRDARRSLEGQQDPAAHRRPAP